MKILNIVLFMTLFVLFTTSITFADGAPLKVEASYQQNITSIIVNVTNISNTSQEFYANSCTAQYNFITDNPSVKVYFDNGNNVMNDFGLGPTPSYFLKAILQPSHKTQYHIFGVQLSGVPLDTRNLKGKLPSFKIGFIYLNKEGKRNMSKEVVWSNPLNI